MTVMDFKERELFEERLTHVERRLLEVEKIIFPKPNTVKKDEDRHDEKLDR